MAVRPDITRLASFMRCSIAAGRGLSRGWMSVAGGNRRKGNHPLDCQTLPCCTWAPSPTGSAPSPLFEASNCRAKGREKLGMWNRGSPQKELPHFFLGLGTWANVLSIWGHPCPSTPNTVPPSIQMHTSSDCLWALYVSGTPGPGHPLHMLCPGVTMDDDFTQLGSRIYRVTR